MKILIAMSGGVDSSVAAYLLRSQGHELIGAMMKLFDGDAEILHETCDISRESKKNSHDSKMVSCDASKNHLHDSQNISRDSKKNSRDSHVNTRGCCTLSDAEDARAVANAIGVPFFVFNYKEIFDEKVLTRFVECYSNGITPNPCIDCNRFVKFEKFLHRANELECDSMATGHYARIEKDPICGRFLLKTGVDFSKDQSYVLYAMTQNQLAKTIFPLGELKKEDVRKIAETNNFINAKKRDSQDICFAPKGDYAGFIARAGFSPPPGNFVDRDGKILGRHKGITNYTVGQRKGLGISASEPLFVTKINAAENIVVLGAKVELFSKKLFASEINFIPFEKLDEKIRVRAKIRYAHEPQNATLWQTSDDSVHVEFDAPQRAITPGQAVVFYDGDIVLGGGTILG